MTNSTVYQFKLSRDFLNIDEQALFNTFLEENGLEKNIWSVFESLFRSETTGNQPYILRVYDNGSLEGAAILIKCTKYGRTLFSNKLLISFLNMIRLPFFLWVKFGCCMDMLSNQGFVKSVDKTKEVTNAMITYLQQNQFLTIINDYTVNSNDYSKYTSLPSLPHAIIETGQMTEICDYLNTHKNIKRKINILRNKGGKFETVFRELSSKDISSLEHCFLATAENSVFYLPYQSLYLESAKNTSKTAIDGACYFIVRLHGKFLGYQAAIKTGKHLNALHGAFDRTRKSNFHAYNVLFVKMTEYAIENRLTSIDFGAVLNTTKQRMVNKTIDMSYFVASKYKILQSFMTLLLKFTKIQSNEQLKFRAMEPRS